MSNQKRLTKPFKITLTEDQIASIIERASSTRRGLKVESLEDRIAPSILPGLGGLGGDPDPSGLPTEDPIAPGEGDPITPPEGSPPMEGDDLLPPPPMEGDDLLPPPPMEGDPIGPIAPPPAPDAGLPVTPPDPFGGSDATGAGSEPIDPTFQDRPIGPTGPAPSPTDGPPTPEAMEEYRANVLKQLRGE